MKLIFPQLVTNKPIVVAYSGGLDSTVLLHVLSKAGVPVRAIHVNHGLQEVATQWVVHCEDQADKLGIHLTKLKIKISDLDGGPEAAARVGRYRAIINNMNEDEVLTTAHHQCDQAETFLMAAMRGSGGGGLRSMPTLFSRSGFGVGKNILHWRPFLAYSRNELLEYAVKNNLTWVEDPHNYDERYKRSSIRKNIIPVLRLIDPGVTTRLARSAEILSDQQLVLNSYLDNEISTLRQQHIHWPGGWNIIKLTPELMNDEVKLRSICHRWIVSHCNIQAPRYTTLNRIYNELILSENNINSALCWKNAELRKHGDLLCVRDTTIQLQINIFSNPINFQNIHIPNTSTSKKMTTIFLGDGLGCLLVFGKFSESSELKWGKKDTFFLVKGKKVPFNKMMAHLNIPNWVSSYIPIIVKNNLIVWSGLVNKDQYDCCEDLDVEWVF